jgi:hypothetical protein
MMMMKLSSLVLITITTSSVVAAISINDPMDTCRGQQNCLMVTINENSSPTICGSQCEYQVCWHQVSFWNTRGGGNSKDDWCMKFGNVDFIGDMHHDGAYDGNGCINEQNSDGKGYWDDTCLDPATVWADSYVAGFRHVCQNVAAGHTVHLLISDGGSCEGTGELEDATSNGITAYCAPSTQDLTHTNPGGQTYFPSSSGAGGGTCSGEDEGDECVWSITVPSTCAYEEGGPYCVDNDNHDTVCPEMESVLKYYENTKNDPPPITPIHDITIHNNGTVGFKVKNPFESDLHEIYTVYHSSDGKGDEVCEKEMSAMECPQDKEFTALCMDDGAWTFITIFATGLDANSGAATLVSNHEGGSQGGSDVYACCPTSGELSGHLSKEYTAAWSYLIHCHCEEEETPQRALLQVSNDLLERFQRGDLFDDELKQIYGISN